MQGKKKKAGYLFTVWDSLEIGSDPVICWTQIQLKQGGRGGLKINFSWSRPYWELMQASDCSGLQQSLQHKAARSVLTLRCAFASNKKHHRRCCRAKLFPGASPIPNSKLVPLL